LFGLLIAAAAIAGVGYFIVSLAPDYIARYLVRTYFQGLAVDTSGVETIDIDPLRGEIRFGPVSFRGSEGEAGQVGQIKVRVDVRRLLSRQALVQSAEIEGIRIDIRQAADGAISINGIPLTQILAEQAARTKAAPAPPPEVPAVEDEAKAWGAGLDLLRLRDSRIVFTSARGGEATLQVNELDLEGFASWAPDEPGRFRLDGDLNRIHIAADGTATPFADNVAVDATLTVSGIELGKIETYTGPLGFSPNAGRIDLTVGTKGSKVLSDGRVDARLVGRASLAGFDLARPEFGSLQLKTGVLNLDDIRLLYDATGTVEVAGNASLDLDAMVLRLKDGTEVGFAGATVGLPALSARLPASGPSSVAIAPQLEVRALRLGGRYVEGTADTVTIRLSNFDIDTQTTGTPLTATGTVEIGGLALVLPLKKPIKIGAGTIGIDLAAMRFAFGPDGTVIDGATGLDIADLSVAVTKRGAKADALLPLVEIGAGTLKGRLSRLALDDATAVTKVKVASPSLVLDRFRLGAPVAPGTDLDVAASTLDLKSTDIDVADGATLEVAGRSTLVSPKFSVGVGGRSGAGSAVELADFSFDPRRFAYREDGPNSDLAFQGRINAKRLGARLPSGIEGMMAAVELGRLRTAVDDFAMDIDNPAPQWHARHLDLALGSLYAAFPGTVSTLLDIKDLNLADGIAASRGEYGFDRLAIGRIDASLTRKRPTADRTAAPASSATPKPKKPAARAWPPKDLPVIRIGRLGLLDGAKIAVMDQTLSPPASSTAYIDTLAVENIDTTNPAGRSDLRMKARLDQAEVTLDGWALPFQPKPDFDLRAKVSELVLPSVNPYVGPEVGLDIVEGKLIANAEAQADAGQLKGEIRAKVIDLGFADRPEAGSDRISRSIGVPLSTIIDLLQDADGSIDLTLPFEGDLLSPQFDYSDMIWSGIFRVLRALIVSPFKLISASLDLASATGSRDAGTAAEAATAPGLPTIPFAPGEAALAADTRGTLLGMQQVLKDRPKMRLRLCGVATAADGVALGLPPPAAPSPATEAATRAPLEDLARKRMAAVQKALMDSAGIERSRLPLCTEPRIASVESGPPRVEVGF
jgi:hypothetical protein